VSGSLEQGSAHRRRPSPRRALAGSGEDPLKSVGTRLDLADGSRKRLPQGLFQVILRSGHAVTSLPAASCFLLLQH
jgi:hypothetical protein